MSTYNVLYYDTTSKEVVYGPLPYFPSGTEYSDYLFWDNTTNQWTVGSSTVHLGSNAGQALQGASSVAIGQNAGQTQQGAGTVVPLAFVASVARNAGNTATLVTTTPHNLITGQVVSIRVSTPNDNFNADNVTITASLSNPFEFSYTNTGLVFPTTAATGTVVGAGRYAVAMGPWAGQTEQSNGSVAIGYAAGSNYQSGFTTVVGGGISFVERTSLVATITTTSEHNLVVGQTVHVDCSIASFSAFDAEITAVPTTDTFQYLQTSGSNITTTAATGTVYIRTAHAVAVGSYAGNSNQGGFSVAIGSNAAQFNQGDSAVAVGNQAGYFKQGTSCVALGTTAGATGQDDRAIAIGWSAGQYTQGALAVAIGNTAGQTLQSDRAVAIGNATARLNQGASSIAIGRNAGENNQSQFSIAIGGFAGNNAQPLRTIILNASGSPLNTTTMDGFFVNPMQSVSAGFSSPLFYNSSSKEILYGTGSIASNIVLRSGRVGNSSGVGALYTVSFGGTFATVPTVSLALERGDTNYFFTYQLMSVTTSEFTYRALFHTIGNPSGTFLAGDPHIIHWIAIGT